ncbi:DNA-binding response regulator [Veronia nyctiphanis]|uniref:DNA-binding response regulator n=1 Tax=Veronia nyctiphanis TaxID=1278244 RepID=A0A4Q0YVZ1_9GAMM|nr:response regulator transcription factor [Veronia nyctiphanis]RXJ73349.1 DNA-binding response regulator [Veronia nyctiphanis]
MQKFLVADDHPLFRDALVSVVRGRFQDAQILESDEIDQTLVLAEQHADIDLILLDLNMPGMAGLKGLLELRNRFPLHPVAIISAETNRQTILQTITYGAVGFISKSAARAQMADAIEQILAGHVFLPANIIRSSEQASASISQNDTGFSPEMLHTLTRRQLLVLKSMAQGAANKKIAYDLNISETTVKSHVSAILRKLGVHNRIQAVVGVTNIDFDRYLKR